MAVARKRIMNVSLHPFDLTDQRKHIDKMIEANINNFHIDIMDGIFVKNFALCQKNILDIKKVYPEVTCEAHMMVSKPELFVEEFAQANTDIFTFHYESLGDIKRTKEIIKEIKSQKMKVGLMLNLDTPIEAVESVLGDLDILALMSIRTGFPGQDMNEAIIEKIKQAKAIRKAKALNFKIEVDGGVRENSYIAMCEAGADIMIVGHFLFEKDYNEQRKKIEEYEVK